MNFIFLIIGIVFSLDAKTQTNFINQDSLICNSCSISSNFNLTTNLIAETPPEDLLVEKVKQPKHSKNRKNFSDKEILINFGTVYAAQWAYYLIDQQSIIRETGSFDNWTNNPLKPHFDKDNFDYNIFKHAITGNYYYLWFRSRGYTLERAFLMSFMASLAFEFTIETITERPSYQDIYQTPVFGTALGLGFEKASVYFHSFDNWFGHTLGYILNPFTLIPRMKETPLTVSPIINQNEKGFNVSLRF